MISSYYCHLQVHARKKPMAEDVDYMAVAGMTEGMVGAELANIVEIAAINMMRDGRSEVYVLLPFTVNSLIAINFFPFSLTLTVFCPSSSILL